MSTRVRAADLATDAERIAELISEAETEPVSGEQVREWDRRRPEGRIVGRAVAADLRGAIVGYGSAVHETWHEPDEFGLWVVVDRARRGAGAGAALYRELERFAHRHGGTRLRSETRDNCPEGLRFAQRRGYAIERHHFESRLDLASFDEAPFVGALSAAEARGIRFASLADLGDTADVRRRLYEVNRATALDIPGYGRRFAPFEDFSQFVFGASWYRPEGQILAIDGERFVGLAAVAYFADNRSAYNNMTGILGEYRGRGMAQALKLLAARFARGCGAEYLVTNNDSENGAMLAINRKLGYRPQPGKYLLVRK